MRAGRGAGEGSSGEAGVVMESGEGFGWGLWGGGGSGHCTGGEGVGI